ncbi:hypothetical protein DPMN_050009 [Dreissena polymorpha]|uniref:Uncharacterized protein n=1 Tax=Dreissena polymorpha TaxID=45954 RepID=A0A9D4HMM2_DREPO|nr:hypothetical protein DPMN_050009 [Dreissena polymorpha]
MSQSHGNGYKLNTSVKIGAKIMRTNEVLNDTWLFGADKNQVICEKSMLGMK